MKVRIVDNLMEKIDFFFGGSEGHKTNPEFAALCDRIAGKEVDIVFTHGDAFEKEDNNWWLPDCCWTPVEANPNDQ